MIGQLAADVLAYAAQTLVDHGYEPPSRRYVSHAAPAGDPCQELVAWVEPVANGNLPPSQVVIHQATVRVQLTLCVPAASVDDPIPAAQPLNGSAIDLADQAWTIWQGLVAAVGQPAGPFGGCTSVYPVDLIPDPPAGGFASWQASFR